jgi:type I restriction enzyme S subunit
MSERDISDINPPHALPPSWAWTRIGDLQPEFQNGASSRGEVGGTPTIVLRLADVANGQISLEKPRQLLLTDRTREKYRAARGDILVVRVNGSKEITGQLIPCNIDDLVYCDHFIRMRIANNLVAPRFLATLGSSSIVRRQIEQSLVSTAGQNTINQGRLRSVVIPLPPRAEQERIIAAIDKQFSRLDAGAAAVDGAQRSLQQMRFSVLTSILRDPRGADWPNVSLDDVLLRGRYGTSTKCSYEGPGLPVLRIPNIQSGTVSFSDLKRAENPDVDLTSTLAAAGDVLVIRTNGSRSLIGRAAVMPPLPYPVAFASYLIQLRVDPSALDPAYLVAALSSPRLRASLEGVASTSAGQYNINLDKLRSIRVPLPPLSAQVDLVAETDQRLSIVMGLEDALMRVSTRAARLRSSILAAAFAGELTDQDQRDEPASVFLEQIARGRSQSNDRRRKLNVTHQEEALA